MEEAEAEETKKDAEAAVVRDPRQKIGATGAMHTVIGHVTAQSEGSAVGAVREVAGVIVHVEENIGEAIPGAAPPTSRTARRKAADDTEETGEVAHHTAAGHLTGTEATEDDATGEAGHLTHRREATTKEAESVAVQHVEVAPLSIAAAASTTEKTTVPRTQVRQLVRAASPDHPKGADDDSKRAVQAKAHSARTDRWPRIAASRRMHVTRPAAPQIQRRRRKLRMGHVEQANKRTQTQAGQTTAKLSLSSRKRHKKRLIRRRTTDPNDNKRAIKQ